MAKRRPRGAGTVEKLPSGRWRARVRVDGAYYPAPETFDAKVDADAWLKRQVDAVAAGTWQPPVKDTPAASVLTVRAYADRWLSERTLKPRTRADYRRLLDRLVLPDLGDIPLSDLRPDQVRSWHATISPGKPTMRAHAYGLLRTIMGTAVEDDLIAASPVRIRGAGSTPRASTTRIAAVSEVEKIAKAMPDRLSAMVWLAAWAGLRFGELTELRRSDIDLDAGVVSVRRAVTWVDGAAIVDTPKSAAGVRSVTLPPHVVPLVAAHLRVHVAPDPGALLFPREDTTTEHLPYGTFHGWWAPARKAAGRKDLRFHDLRHTQATLAAATGATLRELMARLGHSTPGAALKYQQMVGEDRDRAIAEALSGLAGGDVVPLKSRHR